ncbi:tyrosine-protein kinase Src64B-like isoform X2 [Anthonomus grandis grandis]|uniref:tyrosine-protein kinase Src64B-like isoform X2 n=1 Tax=Anthonomus grandis grandis TaxID=2921223 RepID=UPI00216662CB|nr:tyrosine-protein kinase Src64B-like isoform X2 [Anthonomus grandis grandis]
MGSCCCGGSVQDSLEVRNTDHYEPNLSTPPLQRRQEETKKIVIALHAYSASDSQDVSFARGDRMEVLEDIGKWIRVKHLGPYIGSEEGFVQANFVAYESSIESEEWFFKAASRKDAENLLMSPDNPRGTFLIRPSQSDGYSLSIKAWDSQRGYHVKHYKIKHQPVQHSGYQSNMKLCYYISINKTFDSLKELVSVYHKNAFGLCDTLIQPCRKPDPPLYLSSRYRDRWEISRNEIELITRIGTGNFGEVYSGKWRGKVVVAVKMLLDSNGKMSGEEFLTEAAVMKEIQHEKLVQLYGVCTKNEPYYIIQEYMPKGSLERYLRQDSGKTIKFEGLVNIAYQVASGMAYLESLLFIHRDLAARNVLLGENLVAKICDFGLARFMPEFNSEDSNTAPVYISKSGNFPVKWTAPEALKYNIYSTKSDVWSYGIFLTELFTYGCAPYGRTDPLRVYYLVCEENYRMPKPENLPDELYHVMLQCWHEIPDKRPPFRDLEAYFEDVNVSYKYSDHGDASSVILKRGIPYEDHPKIMGKPPLKR